MVQQLTLIYKSRNEQKRTKLTNEMANF